MSENPVEGRFLLSRDRVVNAGAGTGKTHALLTQYLHLLSGLSAHGRPIEPRALGVLTFTDKAAGELRERLQQRTARIVRALGQRGARDSGPLDDEAVAALAAVEPDLVATAAELGRAVPGLRFWARARDQLGGAPIGTFHSFSAALLRRYAAAAGLDPDFGLLDEDRARELRLLAAEHVVLKGLEGQLQAASAEEVARLVSEYGFAGGPSPSGGLVEALCRLHAVRTEEGRGAAGLADPYRPERLSRDLELLVAALRGASAGLAALGDQLGPKSSEALAEAHGLCESLQSVITCKPLSAFAATADLVSRIKAISDLLKRLRPPTGKQADPGIGERLAAGKERLRAVLDELLALQVSVGAAPLALAIERLLEPVEEEYAQRKRAEGGLDFTDLLRRARDLLRGEAAVRAEVRGRFAVLLVDELQDTSPIQAELVELIAGSGEAELVEGGSGPRAGRLFLVGDRKQSIYGFRGADVAAYTALCERRRAAGADEATLARSRRSRPSLLRFANELFPRVMQRPAALSELAPADGGDGGDAGGAGWYVAWDPARDPLQPVREEEAPLPTVELLQPAEGEPGADEPLVREAELITRRILALADAGVRFGDVAILLRRFTHIERYTTALKAAGVPHYVVRGRGFYQAPEVLDIAALFTLLDDPEDKLALLSLLRSPFCALSDEALVRLHLGGHSTLPSLLAVEDVAGLDLPLDEAGRLLRLLAVVRPLLSAGERLGPAACLRAALDQTDYLAVLAADPDGEQRIANVERLLGRARSFEAAGGAERRGGLRGFVRALRLLTDPQLEAALGERPEEPAAQVLGEADDVVRLLTVHQAKGLEFPVVFVAGCAGTERNDQLLLAYDRAIGLGLSVSREGERAPTLAWQRIGRIARLRAEAESARLFYVAATRARDRLIFAGESRRKAPRGSWREHLDSLLGEVAAQPGEGLPLIAIWRPGPLPPPRPVEEAAQEPQQLVRAAQLAVARAYDLPARVEAASGLGLSAAAWAELLVCPRRLRLGELGRQGERALDAARPLLTDEVMGLPAHALRESGLPNRLLLHRDPQREGEDLETVLRGLGLDAEVMGGAVALARRFLRCRGLQRLVEGATAVRWAQRYVVPAGGVQSRGVLDALILSDQGGRLVVTVLDVWDGAAPRVEGPLHGARRQLLALAALGLCPEAERIEVALCYLREAEPVPPPAAVSAAELEVLIDAMQRWAPAAVHTLATLLEEPSLLDAECERIGCEHRAICHPAWPGAAS